MLYNNLYKKQRCRVKYLLFLFGGLSFTTTGLIMYSYLQELDYKKDYNMYHSFHHSCAFISILFYYFIPKTFKFKFPLLRNITSNCDIKNMRDDTPEISIHYETVEKDIELGELENNIIRRRENSPSVIIDRFSVN